MSQSSRTVTPERLYIPFDERLGIHPQDDTFLLTIRGQELVVDVTKEKVTYLPQRGLILTVTHRSKDVELSVGIPFSIRLK